MTSNYKKLNIGCGNRPIRGFINYDYNIFIFLAKIPFMPSIASKFSFIPKPLVEFIEIVRNNHIKYCDVSKSIPHIGQSIDLIYTCHMIEHLDKKETITFLKECFRVLKVGGWMRIVVPDFDTLIDAYEKDKNVEKFIENSYLVGEKPKNILKKLQYLLQGHGWHHQMFTRNALETVLKVSGFNKIKFLDPGESNIPIKNEIDLYDFSGDSIYCEFTK